jgi:hypothetical protein
MGVRHALFPFADIGRPVLKAASFPTLFSTASGVSGLIAGPSSSLFFRYTEFRVRLFSSLGLMVAPPARQPGQDSPAISLSRLDHLVLGRPPLLTARSPNTTGLASSLSGRFSLTVQRRRF